jgi:hypothetical protein
MMELACNQYIINKYKDKPGWTLYYCGEHGPFAQQNSEHTGLCPICKNKSFLYNHMQHTIEF